MRKIAEPYKCTHDSCLPVKCKWPSCMQDMLFDFTPQGEVCWRMEDAARTCSMKNRAARCESFQGRRWQRELQAGLLRQGICCGHGRLAGYATLPWLAAAALAAPACAADAESRKHHASSPCPVWMTQINHMPCHMYRRCFDGVCRHELFQIYGSFDQSGSHDHVGMKSLKQVASMTGCPDE